MPDISVEFAEICRNGNDRLGHFSSPRNFPAAVSWESPRRVCDLFRSALPLQQAQSQPHCATAVAGDSRKFNCCESFWSNLACFIRNQVTISRFKLVNKRTWKCSKREPYANDFAGFSMQGCKRQVFLKCYCNIGLKYLKQSYLPCILDRLATCFTRKQLKSFVKASGITVLQTGAEGL